MVGWAEASLLGFIPDMVGGTFFTSFSERIKVERSSTGTLSSWSGDGVRRAADFGWSSWSGSSWADAGEESSIEDHTFRAAGQVADLFVGECFS